MNVTLFTTDCPQCNFLEAVLKKKNVPFTVVKGADEILKRGFNSAPILEVDGTLMSFKDAVNWINQKEEGV